MYDQHFLLLLLLLCIFQLFQSLFCACLCALAWAKKKREEKNNIRLIQCSAVAADVKLLTFHFYSFILNMCILFIIICIKSSTGCHYALRSAVDNFLFEWNTWVDMLLLGFLKKWRSTGFCREIFQFTGILPAFRRHSKNRICSKKRQASLW